MSISRSIRLCEGDGVKMACQGWSVCLAALLWLATALSAAAQETNKVEATNAPAKPASAVAQTPPAERSSRSRRSDSKSSRLDESAFRIVSERNIFNANRSGGSVRVTSSRRPSRVESFTLVGTLAYEKGDFAFFQGSNSELTKALKPEGVIAGHKLVDILADSVKLEADGKVQDLAVGSSMRREDEGTWKPGEGVASSSGDSSRREEEPPSSSRGRDDRVSRYDSRERPSSSSSTPSSVSSADQADALKRLLERREKE